MIRSAALTGIVLSLLAIAAAYASAFGAAGASGWAPWAMALGTSALLVSLMALGASRHGRLGALWLPLAATFAVLAAGFGLALWLPAEAADADLWLGLPRRAAIVLYGVGILPLLIVPVAYALTFDRLTLTAADLARISDAMAAKDVGAGADSREGSAE